ncbi:hypothetical protein [Saccharibacillus kuerlensis]|uniref:Uncharacterized protein n=1 Tax=Saccharibacillus kuerlensis TaxID=459527 RepID=A0ABQ2L3Q8_9BACL|nr:hypothetical protein [Saccharibacillus kuerlensis]GGO01509.1 hypothetical protein GCM10010969_23900 [Saccharibacillus kuerlensis]
MSDEVNRVHRIPFSRICGVLGIRQKIINVYPDYVSKEVVVETDKNVRNPSTIIEVKNTYLDVRTISAEEYNRMPYTPNVTDKLKALLDDAEREALRESLHLAIGEAEHLLAGELSEEERSQRRLFLQSARRVFNKLSGDT